MCERHETVRIFASKEPKFCLRKCMRQGVSISGRSDSEKLIGGEGRRGEVESGSQPQMPFCRDSPPCFWRQDGLLKPVAHAFYSGRSIYCSPTRFGDYKLKPTHLVFSVGHGDWTWVLRLVQELLWLSDLTSHAGRHGSVSLNPALRKLKQEYQRGELLYSGALLLLKTLRWCFYTDSQVREHWPAHLRKNKCSFRWNNYF